MIKQTIYQTGDVEVDAIPILTMAGFEFSSGYLKLWIGSLHATSS